MTTGGGQPTGRTAVGGGRAGMTTDLKKEIPAYTAPRGRFVVVQVPAMQFLMVDGEGDPNTAPAYRDAVTTIYPLAYAVKAACRAALGRDHVVMPLEALWWSADMAAFTRARDKTQWRWRLLNMVPDWVTPDLYAAARRTIDRKGGAPVLDAVRLESFDEGLSVQTLHVGSYDDEGPVLEAMHREFIPAHGLRMTGRHHEVYLSDARRTPPHRLRTILRQPVARSA